jgi:hypothetical protein
VQTAQRDTSRLCNHASGARELCHGGPDNSTSRCARCGASFLVALGGQLSWRCARLCCFPVVTKATRCPCGPQAAGAVLERYRGRALESARDFVKLRSRTGCIIVEISSQHTSSSKYAVLGASPHANYLHRILTTLMLSCQQRIVPSLLTADPAPTMV